MATQTDVEKALKEPVTCPPSGFATITVLKYVATTNDASPFKWQESLQPFLGTQLRAALMFGAKAKELQLQNSKPANEADTLEAYNDDNAFQLEQFAEAEAPIFSLQRLCEVLLNPFKYNTRDPAAAADDASETQRLASLRPEKLQDALRKCVLTAPV